MFLISQANLSTVRLLFNFFFLSLGESRLAKKTMACQQGGLLKGKALSCLAYLYETSRLLETKNWPRKEAVSL